MSTSQPTGAPSGVQPLPSDAEYLDALDLYGEAHAAIERLESRIRARCDDYAPPPTLEDVGALYSFLDGLRVDVRQLDGDLNELARMLSTLDGRRVDAIARKRTHA